ncbi:MAG: hypothetical protein LQ350_002064 [Teloschistes chrysophthalmus]|nr:MAG: hypothetical protein LQ350_002064 [Niorma chrysophthalma]
MTADLKIGVDLGMTYTGVAFFVPDKTDPERAKLIQKWPGKEDKTENKVPTSLIYHDDKLQSWGFLCDSLDQPDHPDPKRQQYFKLWLDRAHLHEVFPEPDAGISHEDVKRWFTDFLKKLYRHIKDTFLNGPYAEQWKGRVDFVFSVPTTWKSRNVVSAFKECIQKAGFKNRKNHNVSIGLTEAEAAAIHTFRSKALSIKSKDMILVCDAGGGTTDAAVLEAVGHHHTTPQLKQCGPDFGRPVGSVNIDKAFASLVQERLQKAESVVPSIADDDPEWAAKTAWHMSQDRFQYHKCAFGTAEGTHENFRMKIPDFSTSRKFPEACIENKHMTFTRQDMCKLFDEQLKGIYSILDNQLDYLKKERSSKQVDYLVLSGGLGSSVYVKNKLTERYITNKSRHSNIKHLQIYTADDPQIAVVQGLVLNEAQQHETGSATLKSRISPASYGVLCKEPYKVEKHLGMDFETDELDGKLYAIDVIHWFVKKGDPVSGDNPISYDFKRKLSPQTNLRRDHWKSTVVISWKDRAYLPKALGDEANQLCIIKSDTSDLHLKDFEKVGYLGNLVGTKFLVAHYKVKVNIEVADILFEVWCNDIKLSEDQRIQVQWKEGAEAGRPLDVIRNEGRARDIYDG